MSLAAQERPSSKTVAQPADTSGIALAAYVARYRAFSMSYAGQESPVQRKEPRVGMPWLKQSTAGILWEFPQLSKLST